MPFSARTLAHTLATASRRSIMFYSGLRDKRRIKDRFDLRSRDTHRETTGYVVIVHARLNHKAKGSTCYPFNVVLG